jgi:hypothetical protein
VRSDSHIEAWWAGAGHGVDTGPSIHLRPAVAVSITSFA